MTPAEAAQALPTPASLPKQTILPLGSKVRVGNVIYTVEDMGSGIQGKMLDIYYNSHEEAMAHGRTQQEVYLVQ